MRFKLLCFLVVLSTVELKASKCPESRKPHATSCTIFYNCVNLPSGGYVWVPSKCTDGLVFQPYLRVCVLPGDSWTCDNLSTESSPVTNRYETPELIDPNETSYLETTQDSLEFSELVDSSYTTDGISDMSNQDTMTPYPLIEFEDTLPDKQDANEEQELSQAQVGNKTQDPKDKFSMINRLINHLLIYKEITIPLEILASSSVPVSANSDMDKNPVISQSFQKTKYSKNNRQSVLMNYLIQNYVQQNNLHNTIVANEKSQGTTETSKPATANVGNDLDTSTQNIESLPETLTNSPEAETSVIAISDAQGNKEYFTIEKYKSLAHQLNLQSARLIPCVKNTRLPNITDCTRYYTCELYTATITEYSCPLNTAFNKYSRVCDAESHRTCTENKLEMDFIKPAHNIENIDNYIKPPMKHTCVQLGKTKDPTSDSHYYICHSSSGTLQNIKSIRMMCPNSLIFCERKKVCTTQQLCNRIE